MKGVRLLAVILIVIGVAGLAYGGYYWYEGSRSGAIGSIRVSVGRTHTASVPLWVGAAALVLGGGIMFVGGRRNGA